MELRVPSFNIKRIHNIRDFAYEVSLPEDISVGDLALLLNSLTGEAFFWPEGENVLHATSDVDWLSLLTEELKDEIKIEKVLKEGYLEQSKLPLYTAFALVVADVNRLLTDNFKANPLFKRLRKKTKEGWNLSLWQKFVHNFSLGRKEKTKEGLELQVWRWFDPIVENSETLSLPLKAGIEINAPFERIARYFDGETLKRFFAFRVRGSYRVGYAEELDFEKKEMVLNLGGVYKTRIPFEKAAAIFLPDRDKGSVKRTDRLKLLKHLKLPVKVICQYTDLINDAVNTLLEPYMVSLSEISPRGERTRTSTSVVVDKPVALSEVELYILQTGKVYSNPFESTVRINLVDLAERSEKNKKLLRDAKKLLLERLEGFFDKLGLKPEIKTHIWGEKVKTWTIHIWPQVEEFLKSLEGDLKGADFTLVLLPEGDDIEKRLFLLPLWKRIEKELATYGGKIIGDDWLKLFLKTAKEEKRVKMLFEILRELFLLKGGALYILDEPLPFGRVAVEGENGYRIFNLFGEPVGFEPDFEPAAEDLIITKRPAGKGVFFDAASKPQTVRVESGCLPPPVGTYFPLGNNPVYIISEPEPEAVALRFSSDAEISDVARTVLELKKLYPELF
jgi:hypothetical protein